MTFRTFCGGPGPLRDSPGLLLEALGLILVVFLIQKAHFEYVFGRTSKSDLGVLASLGLPRASLHCYAFREPSVPARPEGAQIAQQYPGMGPIQKQFKWKGMAPPLAGANISWGSVERRAALLPCCAHPWAWAENVNPNPGLKFWSLQPTILNPAS